MKEHEMKQVQIRMSVQLHKRIKVQACKDGVSMQKWLNDLMIKELEKLKNQEKQEENE